MGALNDDSGAEPAKMSRGFLALLTLLSMLGMLASNLYLPSLPSIARDLGTDAAGVRATLTVFLVSIAVGQLIAGPFSDRWGRRRVLLTGLMLYTFSSAACAAASTIELMLALRVFQAIGACCISVLVRAIARDRFEGAELTYALAVILTLMTLGPGFSPLLGGIIEMTLGWRADFVLLAIFGACATLLTWRWIPESNLQRVAVISVPSLIGDYRGIATTPAFFAPTLATSFANGGLFAFFAGAPAIFIEHLGFSPAAFGALPAALVFALLAGGAAATWVRKRSGENGAILIAIMLMIAGGAIMLALTLSRGAGTTEIVVPLLLYLAGIGIINPVATAAALQPFANKAGAAAALNGFFQMAGAALGIVLLGFFELPPGLPITLVVCATMALAVFLLPIALRLRVPESVV
jgi:DHA1 family bicyclomycin/chloramphenicol resistance-like MFS transporter